MLGVFDSADSDIMIWGSNMKIEIVKNKLKKTIIKSPDLYTIPILDAIIINTRILLRYGFDKDFTCYSITNDKIIWNQKINVTRLFKSDNTEFVYGIMTEVVEPIIQECLVKIFIESGNIEKCFDLEQSRDFLYFSDYKQLLSYEGAIYDVGSGNKSKWDFY